MKTCKYILIITVLAGLLYADAVQSAPRPRKSKNQNSCTIFRGKFTASDQIEYNYGIVAGQNIATIKSRSSDTQDVITGLMGGVALQIVWPKGLAIQPEILYSQKGCMFSGSGLTYGINYLEVPVKVMYRLHMAQIKPFVFAAPYGAYAFQITEKSDVTSNDTFTNRIKKPDYGAAAGAGFDIWKVQISFKYSWGFAQVVNERNNTVRNEVFTLSAGFFF